MLDQDNFYKISLSIPITCLQDNVWMYGYHREKLQLC